MILFKNIKDLYNLNKEFTNQHFYYIIFRLVIKIKYMFLAHGPAGLVTAYLTKKIWKNENFSDIEQAILYSSSIITGVLPDFDLAYAPFTNNIHHHSFITHKPLIYIILSIILFSSSYLFKNKQRFIKSFSFIFLSTTIIHILTDSLADDMQLFYPFLNNTYRIFYASPLINTNNSIINYFTTPIYLIIEIIFILSALFITFFKLRSNKIVYKYTSISLIIIGIIALISTILVTFII